MKFLCIDCDVQLQFEDRQVPGDGTFAAAYACPQCGHRVAMLANPMETQMVEALGVEIGGRTLAERPMELVRLNMLGREDAFDDRPPAHAKGPSARWSVAAEARLTRVPSFVRGMVKRIYAEYASERGIEEITPAVMDKARSDLGLEGM